MEQKILSFLNYLLDCGIVTIQQLFVLFGPLLLLAFIMNFISQKNAKLGSTVLGQKGYLYIFGWLGTAVHELGHAVFALIFAHKIDKIRLFTPNSGKSLGQVKHRYNAKNPYQTFGNFFIGIGPVLLGAFLLFAVAWLLFNLNVFRIAEKNGVTIHTDLLFSFELLTTAIVKIAVSVWEILIFIFTGPNTIWWKLLLFVYFFYSVGSAVTLSSSDIKGAFRGFLYFVIVLLIFNLATFWMGNFVLSFIREMSYFFSGFYFLIIFSIGLNLVFMLIIFLIRYLLLLFSK